MQLLIGMSMRRYLPAMGTAGSLRRLVSGYSRVPMPPPRIRLSTSCMTDLTAESGSSFRMAQCLHDGGVARPPAFHDKLARRFAHDHDRNAQVLGRQGRLHAVGPFDQAD